MVKVAKKKRQIIHTQNGLLSWLKLWTTTMIYLVHPLKAHGRKLTPKSQDKYGKYAKSGSGGRGRGKGRGRGRGGRGGGGSNAIAKSLASSYKLQADTLGKLTQLLNSTTKKPTAGMNAGKKVVTKKPNLKKITVNMSSKG